MYTVCVYIYNYIYIYIFMYVNEICVYMNVQVYIYMCVCVCVVQYVSVEQGICSPVPEFDDDPMSHVTLFFRLSS